ncbi:hypothetical protein BJV77DRAFT_1054236 [Russula vinacea]|nr:hypothetical protein BJV77DRAFT_1054236 [Russula vinacea]
MTDRRPRCRSSDNPDFLDTRTSAAHSSNVDTGANKRTNPGRAARYKVPGVS